MHITHEKVIDCSAITLVECSDLCLTALEHGPDFKLKADAPDDTLHGFVSIVHNVPPIPHEFIVEVYEVDEAPTALMVHGRMEGRESTLKRPAVMPAEATLQTRLDTLG